MAISFWQIAIVGLLILLLFGKGKISGLMGDVGSGISAFKKGLKDQPAVTEADKPLSSNNSTSQ